MFVNIFLVHLPLAFVQTADLFPIKPILNRGSIINVHYPQLELRFQTNRAVRKLSEKARNYKSPTRIIPRVDS